MLVITRRRNEEITIGTDVQVRVLSIRGNRVQLGIDAPRHIPVHRAELFANVGHDTATVALTDTARSESDPVDFGTALRSA